MSNRLLILAAATAAVVGAASVASASAAPESSSWSETHFVPLETIEVPIVGPHRIEGSLRVKLVLDARDAGAADAIAKHLPQLRTTSLAATLEFSRLYASGLAPVNAERLRSDLTAALQRQDQGIERVLIVEVGAQPA
jgi:flagellar basal body-associated protein FliL